MDNKYFDNIPKIEFKGAQSVDPLSFKYYDASKIVLGKSMEENLRIASCYWHSFSWPGGDPFGGPTFERPWMQKGDAIEMAKLKLENAFDFFEKLGQPYFCFHDADIAPEGSNFAETETIQKTIVDAIQKKLKTEIQNFYGELQICSAIEDIWVEQPPILILMFLSMQQHK